MPRRLNPESQSQSHPQFHSHSRANGQQYHFQWLDLPSVLWPQVSQYLGVHEIFILITSLNTRFKHEFLTPSSTNLFKQINLFVTPAFIAALKADQDSPIGFHSLLAHVASVAIPQELVESSSLVCSEDELKFLFLPRSTRGPNPTESFLPRTRSACIQFPFQFLRSLTIRGWSPALFKQLCVQFNEPVLFQCLESLCVEFHYQQRSPSLSCLRFLPSLTKLTLEQG